MAIRQMSVEEFIAFIRKQQGDQSDKDYAESLGISPQYLCDIYAGRRPPGDSVANALGATRSYAYTVSKEQKK